MKGKVILCVVIMPLCLLGYRLEVLIFFVKHVITPWSSP